MKVSARVLPLIAVCGALIHVMTFLVPVSPLVVLPFFVCLIALGLLLQLTNGDYRLEPPAGPLAIRMALLVYFVGTMYWLYRSTDGASYHQRDGRYYAVSVDRKPLGEVSREEFEQHQDRVARFFSAGLLATAYVSAMTARRVAARSDPSLLR